MKRLKIKNWIKRTVALTLAAMMAVSTVPVDVFAQTEEIDEHSRVEEISLRYDDHYDITGMNVEIIDAGTPTSYQVGYGVEENSVRDEAVVALKGDAMVATGVGKATAKIDGELYEVTVEAAPISLILLAGQSNMQGSEGNKNQSIVCPEGQVYATYGASGTMNASNASNFVASALTGEYRTINVNGTTVNLSGYSINSLNEAGAGKEGPDSGFAYEWVKQTGEKIWVVNAAHGGSAISTWLKGGVNYNEAATLFGACQETLRKEIKAGHFTLSHMGYFWCQGCADETQTAEWYVNKYLTMHEALKNTFKKDMDSDPSTPDVTLEFGGIIPIRSGHQGADSYRAGTYTDTTTAKYFESFKDLRMNGPRVAQYWMGNNPELTDIWNVCTIQEEWATMPDGTDGVEEYFQAHYINGKVDYKPQVAQSTSWYTPKTPAAVHDSIHYNQIGYNEIGREAARNALIYLEEINEPDVEITVKFVGWDGFTPVDEVSASVAGNSGTLVVPMVNPVWKSKDVAYTVSENLTYDYYDLLSDEVNAAGTLTANVLGSSTVTVSPRELSQYRWNFDGLSVMSETADGFTGNTLKKLAGTLTNGMITNGRYQMEQPVVLLHDQSWLVEWKMAGDWSGMILSSAATGNTTGNNFLFKTTGNTGFIGIGEPSGSSYNNYGITINGLGLDMTKEHIYRAENCIAEDGSNMVCLSIDGEMVGALNNYFVGGTNDQNKKVDWVSGKDFVFGYVGTSGHALQKCSIHYIVVDEDGVDEEVHYHDFCDWYEVTKPTATAFGLERRECDGCGVDQTRDVEGVWTKLNLAEHLSELPEAMCPGVNLWSELKHDPEYYASGIDWGKHGSGKVYSITVPVEADDQIYSTSFGKGGTHGGTSNGIRCTFFDAYGVTKTMEPAEVYAEFSANGYLTAPEGAVAVNVPMWTNSDAWEVYILNKDHQYEDGVCIGCGDGTANKSEIADYQGKVISVLGDSISTFAGYIPVADGFNLEHLARYPQDNLLTDVNETWWMQVINQLDAKLGINDSWRGATVSGAASVTTGVAGEKASMANLTRIQNLGSNGTPDVILLYGGTNDLAHVSKVGKFDASTAPSAVDLTTAKWDNLADGYVHTLLRLKYYYPDAEIVAMLPTYTASYYTTTKLAEANAVLAEICEHYGVAYVDLCDCGISAADLPDGIHPGAKGMDYITEAVIETVLVNCEMEAGDHVVHSIKHKLTNVSATLGHWKGISSGERFVETLKGEGSLTVTVTMGGEDITSAVYKNGTITIPAVTGDLVITAKTKFSLGSHLQQLPEEFCSGVNLWTELEHDKYYYTEKDGWGINSLGTVYSITFPVEEGDRIYASSFGKAGTNGYASLNGIRCTFFGEDGVLKPMAPAAVYAEFSANGYLTAPEGAVAVNVPMWTNNDAWEVKILNAEHSYEASVIAPTCTEEGHTKYTCKACGDSYTNNYVDSIWHSYKDGECSVCRCDMLRINLEDIVQYQGGVSSENGTLNTSFTNNWYTNVRIPKGVEQVRALTFKTGAKWGSAFLNGTSFISGFCDTNAGGQWITVDVPDEATTLRYGYLYDDIAQKNGYPTFQHLEFAGAEIEEWDGSEYMERPNTGCHSFTVEVNVAPAMGKPDDFVKGTDYGYILLPTNYSSYGEPTRLIIVCHGAGANIDTYKSNAWKNNNYSFWTNLGYAVMDMYACPPELTGNNDCLHYGNPVVLECYKKGYEYVMEHFNLKQDGIFLIGSSMGGLSSFQIAQSEEFPVIAQVGYCPVIDLFKQAYCNPWTTASYQRRRIASYFGFEGTSPVFTNSRYPSANEMDYYRHNFDKTIHYSPLLRNVVKGDLTSIFNVIPSSAANMDSAEEAIYANLTATHPNPLMIFHNTDDPTVSYRYSKYFVDMVNRSGQEISLYTFTSGGHNAWANGKSIVVQGMNGSITLKESQYQAYLFFDKFEKHTEHISWVDPAVSVTCEKIGLTEGSHCSVCQTVLKKQEVVSATGHKYGAWTQIKAPTCTAKGQERRDCANCDKYEVRDVNVLSHTLKKYSAKAATCTEQGWNAYEECTRCDYTTYKEIPAKGHTTIVDKAVAATCEKAGLTEGSHCSVCQTVLKKQEVVSATGHKYGAWTQIKVPTCTEKGQERRDCANCDKFEVRDVNALGHALKKYSAKAATCTEKGWNAYEECTRCDYTTYKEILEKGHAIVVNKAVTATCEKNGLTEGSHCSVCQTVLKKQEVVSATGHQYGVWTQIKAPTCTAKGQERRDCANCDKYEVRDVNALGHALKKYSAKAATCTEQGWNAYEECTRCNYTTYKELPVKGHTVVVDKAVAATCEKTGLTEGSHCSVCQTVLKKQEVVEAIGHKFGNWIETKAATETAKGEERRDCEKCDVFETREVAALGGNVNPPAGGGGGGFVEEDVVEEPEVIEPILPEEPVVLQNPFVDVEEKQYFFDPVMWAIANDVTSGTSADTFSPNSTCTRAQTVTFLWNAAGKPEPKTTECPFEDVDPTAYYYKAVLWAVEEGITSGTSLNTFGSNQTVTRAQTVTFLWKFANQPTVDKESKFNDVTEENYYHDAVIWAEENEITSGTSADRFSPNDSCTRAQIVTFLYRHMTEPKVVN